MGNGECGEQLDELTGRVLNCAIRVSNTLGCGFLEKVYENSLAIELRKAGLKAEQQRVVQVRYGGEVVGEYTADLLVAGRVLVELKATRALDDVHLAQCLNYLRATGLQVCLLPNFGTPRLQIRRLML